MSEKKCNKCKHISTLEMFCKDNKEYKTCFSCRESRRKRTKCQLCNTIASYGFEGSKNRIRCFKHKEIDMVDIGHKKCKCGKKRPSYGFNTDNKPICCSECKELGMINTVSRKCKCGKKVPTFGFPTDTKATCCSECKLLDMIDVNYIKCRCGKRPNFGYTSDNRAVCCVQCKKPEMISIGKKCKCGKKQPVFGFPTDIKATCCSECKELGMINIKDKKCNCNKEPSFGFPTDKKAICCSECKQIGMINIKHRKNCKCGKRLASFGFPTDTKATCCSECKQPEMINIMCNRCTICQKTASYGIPSNKPSKCAVHKEPNMILKPRARCKEPNCKNTAIYGIRNSVHCEEHKQAGELNLIERKCISCGRLDIVNENGKCINFCLLGNDSEMYKIYRKRQKLKQDRVIKILTAEFGAPDRLDQVVESKCGLERPDIVYDCKTHVIIVEVDENQHKNYCEKGEYNRMKNIFFAFGGIPIVFIRYNPDSYIDCNKNKGKITMGKREEELKRWFKYIKNEIPNSRCSVVYLFYDNYDEKIIVPTEFDPYSKF